MEINVLYIIFSFCLFSIMGWILEVSYRSLRAGWFVNPGFLKGPYLILYGTGSLMLMGCVFLFNLYDVNFVVKIFICRKFKHLFLFYSSALKVACGYLRIPI